MSHHFTFVERGKKLNCRIYPATYLYANGVYGYSGAPQLGKYGNKIKVQHVAESVKILTNVQTFRDCALHQWNFRLCFKPRFLVFDLKFESCVVHARANFKSALRPRGWHVPRRKMRRISCLFLCLFPSQSLIPRTSASAAVCPLELKCSATRKPGAFLLMLRRCSPKRSLRVSPVSPM